MLVSALGHATVLVAGLLAFSSPAPLPENEEAIAVEVIDPSALNQVTRGERSELAELAAELGSDVTFALYGGLAGDQSGADRLRSHFADPGQTPQVTLEWTARGRRMRITRSPEHPRPKRRGTGTTLEPARVHLEERTRAG